MGNYCYEESEVLVFTNSPKPNKTVRRYFERWRENNGVRAGCDIDDCKTFDLELIWNGQPIVLILDHITGNKNDCTPENLRLVCPNCNSQLPTTGGRNINRIQNETSQGYQTSHRDARRDAKVFLTGVESKTGAGTIEPTIDDT